MRRAPYPYPDGEVRIAIKRQFSSVPPLSKRGRAPSGPPPPRRVDLKFVNDNANKTSAPATQPTQEESAAARFAKLISQVGRM